MQHACHNLTQEKPPINIQFGLRMVQALFLLTCSKQKLKTKAVEAQEAHKYLLWLDCQCCSPPIVTYSKFWPNCSNQIAIVGEQHLQLSYCNI